MSKKLLVSKTILINLFKIKFDYFNPTIYKYQQTIITMNCEICDRNQYHQNDLHCSNGLIGPKIKEWFDIESDDEDMNTISWVSQNSKYIDVTIDRSNEPDTEPESDTDYDTEDLPTDSDDEEEEVKPKKKLIIKKNSS